MFPLIEMQTCRVVRHQANVEHKQERHNVRGGDGRGWERIPACVFIEMM